MTILQALTKLRNDAVKHGYDELMFPYTFSILRLLREAIQDKMK